MELAEEQVERRLAAIMVADVVGYSRLMEANEERTLGALRQHRREFLDPTVAKHRGRIFKVMGDGFLVEFGSVLNAVRCAVEIQTGMHDRNAGIPDERQIKFRATTDHAPIPSISARWQALANTCQKSSRPLPPSAASPCCPSST
jgi:adenylate cyclase